ncbi:MAG: VOC family protein [Sphingobacteriales bacterium]|nr:MAG: VOC family protein [Sphingobacteriales bacterium]
MSTINPYLFFQGNCQEAFDFYKSVFGGEFAMTMRNKDVPAGVPNPGENEPEEIMHISLPIGKAMLMGSDEPVPMREPGKFNKFSISFDADSRDEADKIFNALSAGGQAFMPMTDSFWGSYFGMLQDKFGVNWMVSYDKSAQ